VSDSNATGPQNGSNKDRTDHTDFHTDSMKNSDRSEDSEEHRDTTENAAKAPTSQDSVVADLQKRVQELEAQVKEKENRYIYLYADFENFKKRAIKERSDMAKYGCESLARELLESVDNLERALDHIPTGMDKNFISGIQMVLGELKSTLQKQGIERIESMKKEFDPNVHEAVGQEASELPSGTVVREHMGGYTIHGRLLRPARVVISQGSEMNKSDSI
jgi:molecular chaperone GrpE